MFVYLCHRRLAKAGDCAPKALTSVGAFGFYIPLDMKVFTYARVSTKGQRFDAQLQDLLKFGYDEIFKEKVSGRVF